MASYPALDEIVWAQEEPQNMGAWRTIRHRLEEAAGGVPRPLRRAARGARAPPRAIPTAHTLEQERIALAALWSLTRSAPSCAGDLAPNDRHGPCRRRSSRAARRCCAAAACATSLQTKRYSLERAGAPTPAS